MNYFRSAISAASTYYNTLPPINASTLTGAIDVIVVEREDDNGNPELACTPFHVRFGKWQVLRPGEKQVTVLVNGKPIPFAMKIGDAGEAFFVFETDEDIPDELITSPILGPTKVNESTGPSDTLETTESSGPRNFDGTPAMTAEQQKLTSESEPSFLDLSATSPPDTGSLSSEQISLRSDDPSSPPTSVSTIDSASKPQEAAPTASGPQVSLHGSLRQKVSKGMLSAAPGLANLAKSAVMNGPSMIGDEAHVLKEKLARATHRPGRHSGDLEDVFPAPKDGEGEPPEVLYRNKVVLDMAGYHNESPDEPLEVTEESGRPSGVESAYSQAAKRRLDTDQVTPRSSISMERVDPSVDGRPKADENEPTQLTDASRVMSTSSIPSTMFTDPGTDSDDTLDAGDSPSGRSSPGLPAQTNFHRGASEPPELLGASPQNASQEYSWEWGSFPTRSPAKRTFPLKGEDDLRSGSSPIMHHAGIKSETDIDLLFAEQGVVSRDPEENTRFWVTIGDQKVAVQLSLCANLLSGIDTISDELIFREHTIPLDAFLNDKSIAERKELVIKYGGRLLTRADSTPLFNAVLHWRNYKEEKPKQTNALSDDESARPAPSDTSSVVARKRHQKSTSRWSSWFGRARPEVADEEEVIGSASRPAITSQSSAPPETDSSAIQPIVSTDAPPPSTAPPIQESSEHKKTSKFAKTLRLTSDQLKTLQLKKGANTMTFSISATGAVACAAKIYVWDYTDRIVVSDIDGTITKSDALGHLYTMIGRDWTHLGVAKLYTDIARNGYKLMYLTSRAIGQADYTRDYLSGVKQNNYQLPEGPVIMSPDRLMASIHREMIMRKPEVFKMACLRDIQRLFGPKRKTPFYSGFGNRITDAMSYRSVNIPSDRIFTIDSAGEVKMELLDLAGYKSSYIHMTDLVDQMFPPIHRNWANDYTDFNYWKDPLPEFDLPDLDPPSPALSAVSDTSGVSALARLRNFSLGRVSSNSSLKNETVSQKPRSLGERPSSPLASEVISDASLSDDELERQKHSLARRRQSMDSMPGSLPGSDYGGDSEEEEVEDGHEEGSDYGDEEGVEDEEPVFDDDILATGEMESVPFI